MTELVLKTNLECDAMPGWRFERFQYDGAPLIARRIKSGYTVEIDNEGDLQFDEVTPGHNPFVSAAVLRELIADARTRMVPGWEIE